MVQGRLGGPGDYVGLRIKLQALQAACALECVQLDRTPASRQGSYIAIERCSQAIDNGQVQMQFALLPWRLGVHAAAALLSGACHYTLNCSTGPL